jgi:hypothetical protein
VHEEPDDTNPMIFVVIPFGLLLVIAAVWVMLALMVGGSLLWIPIALVLGGLVVWLTVVLARPASD